MRLTFFLDPHKLTQIEIEIKSQQYWQTGSVDVQRPSVAQPFIRTEQILSRIREVGQGGNLDAGYGHHLFSKQPYVPY
jgi:hypothetical protein